MRGLNSIRPGISYPLGATPRDGGVNFCVFSDLAEGMDVLLFNSAGDAAPACVIQLDPRSHRTYHFWHAFVPDLGPGQIYAYRAHGPYAPERGLRFDGDKVLLDPYGRAVVVPPRYSRAAASKPGDNAATAMKSVVVDPHTYDWEDDRTPGRPFSRTVTYELHVAGFTRHPSSGLVPPKCGTYAGLVEKIPYLLDLGITAVELLPIFQFDRSAAPPGLVNYWGYQPVSFFAPHTGYSSRPDPVGALDEFRDMVKALHRAGIEVFLDVVYNHTAEGDEDGPTLSLRGLANDVYYLLDPDDPSRYADYTGCGNTLNANHAVVRRLIRDSLRYWVQEMHVDGFRFDLAAILSRDEEGQPLATPPVVWSIDTDPILAGAKLIAEAWDAGGLYQVGVFSGDRWMEWNGRFRDDVRGFVRGDNGLVPALAYRLTGSPDLYGHEEREPEQSVNFVTCHDGFTLNDLVSYSEKHNLANGEDNHDGYDDNRSWNCGVEGPSDDPDVEALRNRQVKNLLTLLLTAVGAPMLLMGDEVRRTQRGNNNAYCQDNDISWFDWTRLERHRDVHRFVRMLIAQRTLQSADRQDGDSLNEVLRKSQIHLHGVRLNQPDQGLESHSLAYSARTLDGQLLLHFMINAYWEPLEFELPPLANPKRHRWRAWLDTSRPSPDDIHSWSDAPRVEGTTYRVAPRSIAALVVLVD